MSADPAATPSERTVLEAVRAIVLREIGNGELTLGDVALELNYCERHLRRLLGPTGGFRQVCLDVRMPHAARQLLTGRRVNAVAVAVGYKPAHVAAPFVAYFGLRPSEVRRVGTVTRQLRVLADAPLRSADLAARCRAVDRWTRLWNEAASLLLHATNGTIVAIELTHAVAHRPPRRPRPVPRGRRRRQAPLQRAFLEAVQQAPERRREAQ
jgi:AraC-like DNA-binding protein